MRCNGYHASAWEDHASAWEDSEVIYVPDIVLQHRSGRADWPTAHQSRVSGLIVQESPTRCAPHTHAKSCSGISGALCGPHPHMQTHSTLPILEHTHDRKDYGPGRVEIFKVQGKPCLRFIQAGSERCILSTRLQSAVYMGVPTKQNGMSGRGRLGVCAQAWRTHSAPPAPLLHFPFLFFFGDAPLWRLNT